MHSCNLPGRSVDHHCCWTLSVAILEAFGNGSILGTRERKGIMIRLDDIRGGLADIIMITERHLSNVLNWNAWCCGGHWNGRWVVEKRSQSKMIENSLEIFGLALWNSRWFDDWIAWIFNLLHAQEVENNLDEFWIEIEKDIAVGISSVKNSVVVGSKVVASVSIEELVEARVFGCNADGALEDLEDSSTGVNGDDLVLIDRNRSVRHDNHCDIRIEEGLRCSELFYVFLNWLRIMCKTNYVH